MIIINSVMDKIEPDGMRVVKVVHGTSTVFGYGDTTTKALQDASENLSSIIGQKVKVLL